MSIEPVLEIDEIQGNLIPGFRMPYQVFIGIKTKEESNVRDFFSFLLGQICNMRQALAYNKERLSKAKQLKVFGKRSFTLPDEKNMFWINLAFGNKFIRNFSTDPE